MHGPWRMALAALGLALFWGGPPAQAPALARARSPGVERPSGTAAQLADWVVASGDNGGRPFLIVDKLAAEVFVFDAQGRLEGAAPVLVGLARGDDSAPGVGGLPLAAIRPDERTTPAGRFVAHFGEGHGHHLVLWVDDADEIALHPVVTAHPRERRLQRLRSPAPASIASPTAASTSRPPSSGTSCSRSSRAAAGSSTSCPTRGPSRRSSRTLRPARASPRPSPAPAGRRFTRGSHPAAADRDRVRPTGCGARRRSSCGLRDPSDADGEHGQSCSPSVWA